jgi:aminoglycoside 6'-N-acetyltransferase I
MTASGRHYGNWSSIMNMTFRMATIDDVDVVTELMLTLYEDNTFESLYQENRVLLTNGAQVVYLAYADEKAAGFAHCSLRHDYVEGTNGSAVGYLEGIYVVPEYRRHSVARSLLSLCEAWTRKKGCAEFASDCELGNPDSIEFHLKIGFREVNRIVCFTKEL